ncbi:MAG: helix-turn-helix domain-containing protein [Cyclobacteriaceae bacterium]
MSPADIFLIIVSGLGVIHGLFLAIFLWSYSKGNSTSNRILSTLLFVLSFRVGKSVLLEFATDLDVKIIFGGLGTLMIIGPLFYFYTISIADKSFRFKKRYLAHFVPALVGISFGVWLQDHHLETLPLVLFAVLFLSYYTHYLIYIIMSYMHITRKRKSGSVPGETWKLFKLLFIGLLIIWFAYVLNLFDDLVPYVVGPVLYSIVAYTVSFIVIKKGYLEKINHEKYRSTPVSDEQMIEIYNKLFQLIKDEKKYMDPGLTLKSLSTKLGLSTQVLSQVVNLKSGMNFNHFINKFRVEQSIMLLNDSDYQNRTIASIAMDVGFNSISSFNSAFKKITSKTPVAYRNELIK